VQRRISRVYSKDHAGSFYGKSATDTADGSIGEKVERATRWLLVPFLAAFLAAGVGWFNADLPARGTALLKTCGRKKARFDEAGLIPLLLDESQGDGLIVSPRGPNPNQQCLLNLCRVMPRFAAATEVIEDP
jgi:hypothetical protein